MTTFSTRSLICEFNDFLLIDAADFLTSDELGFLMQTIVSTKAVLTDVPLGARLRATIVADEYHLKSIFDQLHKKYPNCFPAGLVVQLKESLRSHS